MKKLVFLVILFSSITSLKAQETERFGISAGINISNMKLKPIAIAAGLSPLVGFNGYIFYNLPLGGNFSLQNELGYDGMGFKFYDLPGFSYQYTENIDYLTLSILPRYNLKQTGFYFFGGPSLGYLFHANSQGGDINISSTAGYHSLNLFGIVGEEYFFPMGIGVTARYMYGLINVAKGSVYGGSAFISAITFTLAYKFHTGK
jgi:outer membrane immunogenic protein